MPVAIVIGVLVMLGGAASQDARDSAAKVDSEAAASACMSEVEVAQPIESFTEARRHGILACVNAQAAAQLNAQMPRRLDAVTTLEQISTSGTTLTYHLRVDTKLADLPEGSASRLAASTRSTVCASQDMRSTIGYGGVYRYIWLDRAGEKIHELRIDRC